MNIEGVNLLPLLSGNSRVEGGVQTLLENGAIPEDFANALMGQIGLLSEANGQAELPGQLQGMAMPQPMDNLRETGDLLKQKGDGKELVALFEKYLPISDKKNEAPDLNGDVGLEATLLALADALKPATPSIAPDEVATTQDLGGIMALNGPPFVKPLPDGAKLDTPVEDAASGDSLQKETVLSNKKNEAPDLNEDVGLEATLPALVDALKSIMPSVAPDEAVTAQDLGGVMALNGLPFVKPLPDGAKLDMPVEDVASGDFLQKDTAPRQPIQDGQGLNLQSLEDAGVAKKTLAPEKQASLLGLEKAVPGVTTDMLPIHRPVDNRADSPAITRPLTHPGWSEDLGEQILWMNNKAIPAAELKLNPAHLGPISVRIDVNQDQATIMFTAQHAEVKEAIEASIPKLREMLVTQQLNLVNVNISQNSTPDQGRPQSQTFSKTPGNHEQGSDGLAETMEKIEPDQVFASKGLLSLYA